MIFRKEKKNINALTWRYTEKFGIYWKKSIVELNVLFSRLYQKQTPKRWSFSGSLRKFSAKLFLKIRCAKSVQIRNFFWSVFSRIRTEYGAILRISPYSVRVWDYMDRNKIRIWTLFTQWFPRHSQVLKFTLKNWKLLEKEIYALSIDLGNFFFILL